MHNDLWKRCLDTLEAEVPEQQLNLWIRPLQVNVEDGEFRLLAPNRFVQDWVKDHYLDSIQKVVAGSGYLVTLSVGGRTLPKTPPRQTVTTAKSPHVAAPKAVYTHSPVLPDQSQPEAAGRDAGFPYRHGLKGEFVFESFVVGNSNQIARAAAVQVGENPGSVYNPLYLYGGVGLGKTHLMQAVGNAMIQRHPDARVAYVHSERFVGDMVRALQHNGIEAFKRHYRSVNALLIDDVQFFAGKDRSQEEFFHTFNALLESGQQIVMTCDRYPKEVDGVEERLRSRFGWGLTCSIDPPELETRVAILQRKAEEVGFTLPEEVAFFIGKRIRSNVRELEGALKRVVANSRFTGESCDLESARHALRDILALQEKMITVPNIQKTVAAYFKIRVSDLLSKNRSRSVARPRQIAMALAKDLTNHSLPEIGDSFGGRDHTTVLHAYRKVKSLRDSDTRVKEDFLNLLRTLQQ